MENSLTDKVICVMLEGKYKTYISQNAYQNLLRQIETKNFVVIDGKLINTKRIIFAMSASEVESEERIKKGDWLCDEGYWHQRGDKCGHTLQKNYDQ